MSITSSSFIHPFIDGNSRLTRTRGRSFLQGKTARPIYEIPVAYISRYSSITKGAKNRDDNKLFRAFSRRYSFTYSAKSKGRSILSGKPGRIPSMR